MNNLHVTVVVEMSVLREYNVVGIVVLILSSTVVVVGMVVVRSTVRSTVVATRLVRIDVILVLYDIQHTISHGSRGQTH